MEVWPVTDEPEPLLRFTAATKRPIIWALNWTADGKSLLTAGNDGRVRMWDASTGRGTENLRVEHREALRAAFSPDGLTCAACSAKGQVVIWDVDN